MPLTPTGPSHANLRPTDAHSTCLQESGSHVVNHITQPGPQSPSAEGSKLDPSPLTRSSATVRRLGSGCGGRRRHGGRTSCACATRHRPRGPTRGGHQRRVTCRIQHPASIHDQRLNGTQRTEINPPWTPRAASHLGSISDTSHQLRSFTLSRRQKGDPDVHRPQ